jgi:hypothetical protein
MRRLSILGVITLISMTPPVVSAATAMTDSRSAALTQNLGANAIVITSGYHVAGDGGGATFKNVGNAPLSDVGASFTDAGGTNWQYVPDPHGVQIRQFGAKCDWNIGGDGTRNYASYDAAATDDSGPLRNAINFAGLVFANGEDVGGGAGRYVRLPKGACKIGSQVRILNDVILAGEGALSSVLVMPQAFDGASHFLVLGTLDQGPEIASFGARLEELGLWSVNTNANYNAAMVFSRKTQHTGGLARVKILAGNRVGVFMEAGVGGASMFLMEDIEVYNTGNVGGGNPNPGVILAYAGSSISNLRNIVVQGPSSQSGGPGGPNHIGIRIDSGIVNIDGFHTENIATGILVNQTNPPGDGGITRLHNLSGGAHCTSLVLIQGFVPTGATVVGMASPNGCTNTVHKGSPNFQPVTTKIVADAVY